MVRNKKQSLTKQEREEQHVGKNGCEPWRAGSGWTGDQGIAEGWVGLRDERQEMLPGGKRHRKQNHPSHSLPGVDLWSPKSQSFNAV